MELFFILLSFVDLNGCNCPEGAGGKPWMSGTRDGNVQGITTSLGKLLESVWLA